MKYNLTLQFNGETKKKRTDNIAEAILSLKPEDALYTELYMTIQKVGSKDKVDRLLNLKQGRQLFNSEAFMEAFLANLQLEYGTL